MRVREAKHSSKKGHTLDIKLIKQVVDLMKRSDISEFEFEEEGFKLRLKGCEMGSANSRGLFHLDESCANGTGTAVDADEAAVRAQAWVGELEVARDG